MSQVKFNIESSRWIQAAEATVQISGWAFPSPAPASLRRFHLLCGSSSLVSCRPTSRPDVASFFSIGEALDFPSGFSLTAVCPHPEATLQLAVELDSGELITFHHIEVDLLPGRGPSIIQYEAWSSICDPIPDGQSAHPREGDILFSILLPVYRTPLTYIRECIESIRGQFYTGWELIVVDDGSEDENLSHILQTFARADSRIRLIANNKNRGIANATNDALASAVGDFVVLIDHDDLFRPHTLSEFAARLHSEPSLNVLYSDEDKLSPSGTRTLPLLKPAFSPEFLRGVMYVGHALCVRTSFARLIGGFDPAFDGIQDYEFLLRASEHTTHIGHVPRILYHWRQSPHSSAMVSNIKGDIDALQVRAVAAHLSRIGDCRIPVALGGHRVRLNPSGLQATFREVRRSPSVPPVKALLSAAAEATEDILIFVHEEVPPLAREAIENLAALALLPDSAFVSAVLLSPDSRILESGLTFSIEGVPIPVMNGFDAAGDGFNGSLLCNREVAAVSPWCIAVRRSILDGVSNDIASWLDLCRELRSQNFYHRVCASARLTLPYNSREYPRHLNLGLCRETDPFYNPHFLRNFADYRLSPRPSHFSQAKLIVSRLEIVPPHYLLDGALRLRGWAFHLHGKVLQANLVTEDLRWSTSCNIPRPDVAAVYRAFPSERSGFTLNLRLEPGSHRVSLSISAPDSDESILLLDTVVRVPFVAPFYRICRGSPASLLASQFLTAPSHPPRSLEVERFPTRRSNRAAALPRVTIVTPSFQHAPFIEETLRSVLDQSLACDYVVQDGASTDGSVDLIRRHADRLHAFASEPDSGQADAIRRAFAKTSGAPDDVMAWINSDDFYLPGALAYVAHFFAAHPEVDALYGHRVVVDEHSREIGRWFLPPHDPEVLRLNDFVPQETLFWRRRLWDRVGGIDPSFQFALDWDLLLRFQAAGANIVRVPYFLACFRVHSAQKTTAQISSIGQREIDALRRRTFGRPIPPSELENHPRLARYLRHSARIELLRRTFGIRSR